MSPSLLAATAAYAARRVRARLPPAAERGAPAPTEEERLDQMTGHAPNTFAWNTISRGEGEHMFNRGDVFKRLVDYIAKVQVPAC